MRMVGKFHPPPNILLYSMLSYAHLEFPVHLPNKNKVASALRARLNLSSESAAFFFQHVCKCKER